MIPRQERLFVEYVGASLNELFKLHWKKRQADRKALQLATRAALGFGRETFTAPVTQTYTPHLRPGRRSYDVTNYIACTKPIEDALVKGGLLVDDSPTWVREIRLMAPVLSEVEGIEVVIVECGPSVGLQAGMDFDEELPF